MVSLKSRNIPSCLSLGFCALGILELIVVTPRNAWPPFPGDILGYLSILLPHFLAIGAAVLTCTGRSARLSLWVLALFWLTTGVSELNYLLPPDEYFTLASAASPAVWTLFAVVCIGYLGSDLLRIAPNGMSRTGRFIMLIAAAITVYGPILGYNTFLYLTDKKVSRFIFGDWGFRIYYVYGILCICIVIYEWISGTAAIKMRRKGLG